MKSAICCVAATLAIGTSLTLGPRPAGTPPDANSLSVIVQARDSAEAATAVREVGGAVTHELRIIDAVGASLTARQRARLMRDGRVRRVYDDGAVSVAGGATYYTAYAALVEAHRLHAEGLKGKGITVAVLDTGLWKQSDLTDDTRSRFRIAAQYDVIRHRRQPGAYATGDYQQDVRDESGHGTHVTAVLLSRGAHQGRHNGLAPDARLVVVKAFGPKGQGTYADVVRGIDWIVSNKATYGIRVLNCSFSAPVRSHYWDDPINQALMKAWNAGIVVVASAGNTGPKPMTVGVPGNLPYVITVGAMTDSYTPHDRSDDRLASFSSRGPTVEGFVKPEVVAPGGHMVALMTKDGSLGKTYAKFYTGVDEFFMMSGTSQSAAVVSGVVALMLQREPWLSPDDVKCRLMATARAALDASGKRAYSVFQQGAGLVDAYAAAHSAASGCANLGLDVTLDLAGTAHYGGPANRTEDGEYYLMGLEGDGYVWKGGDLSSGGYLWSDGHPWSDAYLWSGGYLWSDGYLWNDGYLWALAYLWSGGYLWSDSYLWSNTHLWKGSYVWSSGLTETMSVNRWVNQE